MCEKLKAIILARPHALTSFNWRKLVSFYLWSWGRPVTLRAKQAGKHSLNKALFPLRSFKGVLFMNKWDQCGMVSYQRSPHKKKVRNAEIYMSTPRKLNSWDIHYFSCSHDKQTKEFRCLFSVSRFTVDHQTKLTRNSILLLVVVATLPSVFAGNWTLLMRRPFQSLAYFHFSAFFVFTDFSWTANMSDHLQGLKSLQAVEKVWI